MPNPEETSYLDLQCLPSTPNGYIVQAKFCIYFLPRMKHNSKIIIWKAQGVPQ